MARTKDQPKAANLSDGPPRPWRWLAAFSSGLFWLFAATGWLGIIAWGLGEAVSDRYAWSQWLEWIPTIFTLIGAFTCLGVAWIMAVLRNALRQAGGELGSGGESRGPKKSDRPALFALRSGWLAWTVVLVYFVVAENPFYKPAPEPPAFDQDSFRLVYWNAGGEEKPGWDRAIGGFNPDILVLNGLRASAAAPGLRSLLDSSASVVVNDLFTVISKRPIVRWGATSLAMMRGEGIDPRQDAGNRRWVDHGRGLFFQFRCPPVKEGEAPTVRTAWVIDLPSDLSLSRAQVTARANEVIETFPGPVYVKDSRGAWVPEAVPGSQVGFPTPDLITGDFNIPRGSWSLRALTTHLRDGYPSPGIESVDAYDQAARRFCASWPRPRPFLHLDQTFLGPKFRAWSYSLRDPGSAEHFAQIIDVASR